MKKVLVLILIILMLVLSGCNAQTIVDSQRSDEEKEFRDNYYPFAFNEAYVDYENQLRSHESFVVDLVDDEENRWYCVDVIYVRIYKGSGILEIMHDDGYVIVFNMNYFLIFEGRLPDND